MKQENIGTFELEFDHSYEGYKNVLLSLYQARNEEEKKILVYYDNIKKEKKVEKNREKMVDSYRKIEEITILWYNLLQEAYKDFPEISKDKDLPRGTRDSVDPFSKERVEAKEALNQQFVEAIQSLYQKGNTKPEASIYLKKKKK